MPVSSNTQNSRIGFIDFARGVALIAMTMFHFGWDLEAFGFVERGFSRQPAMIWFARAIATSFLILVGISLVLGHQKAFNAAKFLKRFGMVAGAALVITIATYFATPKAFIFFGILHHIALASVVGLLFLRFNWVVNLVCAAIVLCLAFWARTEMLDAPIWWWTGLSKFIPVSNDYVPMFPFFAAVLFGIALAQLGFKMGWNKQLSQFDLTSRFSTALRFIGRHSLVYYLIHQPIMIGILYIIHMVIQ